MEEIIQILIFVGAMVIAVVGQSAKNKKKPMMPSPEEVLEDVFPDADYLQPEKKTPQVQSVRPATIKKTFKEVHTSCLKDQQTPSVNPRKQTEKIKLNTRAEARKAFIYSEIFNRKY